MVRCRLRADDRPPSRVVMAAVVTKRRFDIPGMVFTPGIGWHDPKPHIRAVQVVHTTHHGSFAVPMKGDTGINPAFITTPRS